MQKSIIVFIFPLLFLAFATGADSIPKVNLIYGENEVTIKIANKTSTGFHSLYIDINDKALPESIICTAFQRHQRVFFEIWRHLNLSKEVISMLVFKSLPKNRMIDQ